MLLNSNKHVTAQVVRLLRASPAHVPAACVPAGHFSRHAVRWRHVVTRSSCLNGKSGHGRLNAAVNANF